MTQANWTPPQDFIEVPSADDKIRVWAPIPQSELSETSHTYNCPNCGAPTKFDITTSGLSCVHCGYQVKPDSKNIGKAAQELEFRTETIKKADMSWYENRNQVHCENCGANLLVEKNDVSVKCLFCASNKVILQKAPAQEFYPSAIIPFKTKPAQVESSILTWLGKGWFHPKELQQNAKINKLSPIYIPAWTFDTDIDAQWKALVGYERQKRYYDSSSKTWKSKTVIDWRWEDGQVNETIDDFLISGSDKIQDHLFVNISNFNLSDLMEFSPDFLVGIKAQLYSKHLPEAWNEAKGKLREYMKDACYHDIPTSHVRNFSLVADFQNETWRIIFLPIYIITYIYQQNTYQVVVNGQTNQLAGQKPVDWNKIWLAFAGLFAPGIFAAFISLILLVLGTPGLIGLLISFFLLVIGGIIAVSIYQKAKASEKGS